MQPTDVLEWRAVTEEMQHFLAADSPIPSEESSAEGSGGRGYTLSLRCALESPLAGKPLILPKKRSRTFKQDGTMQKNSAPFKKKCCSYSAQDCMKLALRKCAKKRSPTELGKSFIHSLASKLKQYLQMLSKCEFFGCCGELLTCLLKHASLHYNLSP